MRELDGYTLADLILKPKDFRIKPAALGLQAALAGLSGDHYRAIR
jgi:hypothetical protein